MKKSPLILAILLGACLAVLILFFYQKHANIGTTTNPTADVGRLSFKEGTPYKVTEIKASSDMQTARQQPPKPENELIAMAFLDARKVLEIPSGIVPSVTYKGDTATIVWAIPKSPDPNMNKPGPDYYALVEIDRYSGHIITVLAGS